MLNFFYGKTTTKPMKGFKITTVDRKQKYGVAANSLKMLMEKAAAKLKIKDCRVYLAKDGTEIQDEGYFETIEPQTLFVIASPSELIKTDFQLMYEAIRNQHSDMFNTADAIRNFVTENRSEFDRFVGDYQTTIKETVEKTRASQRDEHGEWFEGIPASLTTKEEVMARRSQDRIRGYFYKTKEEMHKAQLYRTNKKARQMLDEMLEIFQYFLMGVDHFSALFNRKWGIRHKTVATENDDIDGTPRKKAKIAAIRDVFNETSLKSQYYVSLCDELGEFRCHGVWCDDRCKYGNHSINPYATKENVILFQMWNLDHQIEISRSVIPKILEDTEQIAVHHAECKQHKQPAQMISIMKYFLELFTMDNLRLVHIVCHDKAGHDLRSNGKVLCEKCAEYKSVKAILNKIAKAEKRVDEM